MQRYTCPACGYPGLLDEPRTELSGGSFEICPSCGIQFGYSDEHGGNAQGRASFYRGWGTKWYLDGARWHAPDAPPAGWDGREQYRKHVDRSRDIAQR